MAFGIVCNQTFEKTDFTLRMNFEILNIEKNYIGDIETLILRHGNNNTKHIWEVKASCL